MNLRMGPEAKKAVEDMILLTGPARSGTSMMATLIHSLKDMEFAFEPPMLNSLIPLIDEIPEETWRLLYETATFEEMFFQAIPGRRLNMNRHDDSSFFAARPEEDLEWRVNTAWRRLTILPKVAERRFGMKTVYIAQFVKRFRSYYPKAPVIMMVRRPEAVLKSTMVEGWTTDAELNGVARIFPLKANHAKNVPFWILDEDVDRWVAMSELERTVYSFIVNYRYTLENKDCLLVDYDAFVQEPHRLFAQLIESLGCLPGPKTEELLDGVREPQKDRTVHLESVNPLMVEEMYDLANACRKHCLK